MSNTSNNGPNNLYFSESATIVKSEGKELLKVPVGLLGEWKHPEYGTVTFTQTDFDQMVNNWQQGKASYDPPLWLGHPIPGGEFPTIEGQPSEGWPVSMYQEGNVLWTEYEPTNPQLIEDVRNKRYRYASPEVQRNAVDKSTGENLGSMLVGAGLTNRPFLDFKDNPLSVVTKFSDSSKPQIFSAVINLNPQNDMTTSTDNTTKPEAAVEEQNSAKDTTSAKADVATTQNSDATTTTPAASNLQGNVTASTTNSLSDSTQFVSKKQHEDLLNQFAAQSSQLSQVTKQLNAIQEANKQQELSEKLARIEALNLPTQTKEMFSDLLKKGQLASEAESNLFQNYQSLSDSYGQTFNIVEGTNDKESKDLMSDIPQCFADIIQRNNKIAQARGLKEVYSVSNPV